MSRSALWDSLRARFGTAGIARRSIALQHLVLSDRDVSAMRAVLDRVGEQLAVTLELQRHAGDVVLLDADLAARMSPQLIQAFTDERPVVRVRGLHADDSGAQSATERFEHCQQDLLRQLRALPLVRQLASAAPATAGMAPDLGFDSAFDSQIDADQLASEEIERGQRQVLQAALRGLRNPAAPALTASYGPTANLRFDFRARLVTVDPKALQLLRVKRELPQPAPGARPQPDYLVRELDETLWDLGLASGPFTLVDEPADWWHTPLALVTEAAVERHSRTPWHLDAARLLASGPLSPSELRRRARVDVADLRCFIQACLLLGLLRWAPQG